MLGRIKNLRQTVEGRMLLTFVVTILLLEAGALMTRVAHAYPPNAEIDREWATWPAQDTAAICLSTETIDVVNAQGSSAAEKIVESARARNIDADAFRWNRPTPYRMRCAR